MSSAENPVNETGSIFSSKTIVRDLIAGLVVFLVALPLCLGIALASDAPLFSGLLAGILGGLVVGALSGSHTSVSGPAAGLTAIVSAQIANLGSFEAFLVAVFLGGIIQIVLGIVKAGALSAFFPSSVIKGLLAAIGAILILKQIPHLFGHDSDPEGEMSFIQPDEKNTFSEIGTLFSGEIHIGATAIGLISVVILVLWGRSKFLKSTLIPGPLVVVLLGVGIQIFFQRLGGIWIIEESHLVTIPVAGSFNEFIGNFTLPDFSALANVSVYIGGITVAVVASLETLLNLEAVDKLDKQRRNSPASRELIAQGVGNTISGLIGGLPMTSVIVRSSVNVNMDAQTKFSAIFHGFLLILFVGFFPMLLNLIPLSALAAILIVTGFKLANPVLFRESWNEGRYQFIPFIVTFLAIVFSDLLIGILIGLCVSLVFILNSNLRKPVRRVVEHHLDGDVIHVELANQVSFLNRAGLDKLFQETPPESNLMIDATETDYMDPDILSLIRDFKNNIAPKRNISVSLRGFRDKYNIKDEIQFADYSTRELQDRLTPQQVLNLLKEGNHRFRTRTRLTRDLVRQMDATAGGQNPLAVILSCIDSRVPAELVFDLGIGDIFSVRVAGNIIGSKTMGSIEYAVSLASVKLVLVLGHTRCGAVTSSVNLIEADQTAEEATGCTHLHSIVDEIQPSVHENERSQLAAMDKDAKELFVDEVAKRNVLRTVDAIIERSPTIQSEIDKGQVMVVGALYDVKSGDIEFFMNDPSDES